MEAFGRILLAVVAGMALAFVLVVLVELFSSAVHPFPADFNGNIPEHGKRYPHGVLAAAALFWGGGKFTERSIRAGTASSPSRSPLFI
jgi:hypothetical protein